MSHAFNIPLHGNLKLKHVMGEVLKDEELNTLWKCSNVMAIDRMGYSDHGPTHAKIVANFALKILRILVKNNIPPSLVRNYKLANEDAEVVVVLSSMLHDVGMVVTRDRHEVYGALLAKDLLNEYLASIYPQEERTVISSEVLHAIVCHEDPGRPLTVEAGIVRIADSLDMEKGRARIPFQAGKVDIHNVSALSIEKVAIQEGGRKPVTVMITMSNSAGVFQIDELLKPRIENSGLQDFFHVIGEIVGEKERRIIEKFEF
jgi:metal-dependent HD superfamily phosphatase/phosphodiesterase